MVFPLFISSLQSMSEQIHWNQSLHVLSFRSTIFSPKKHLRKIEMQHKNRGLLQIFLWGFSREPAVHFARVYTSKTLSFVTLSAAKAIPTGNDVLCYLAVGMVGLVFGEGVYGYRLPKTHIFIHFCT